MAAMISVAPAQVSVMAPPMMIESSPERALPDQPAAFRVIRPSTVVFMRCAVMVMPASVVSDRCSETAVSSSPMTVSENLSTSPVANHSRSPRRTASPFVTVVIEFDRVSIA